MLRLSPFVPSTDTGVPDPLNEDGRRRRYLPRGVYGFCLCSFCCTCSCCAGTPDGVVAFLLPVFDEQLVLSHVRTRPLGGDVTAAGIPCWQSRLPAVMILANVLDRPQTAARDATNIRAALSFTPQAPSHTPEAPYLT